MAFHVSYNQDSVGETVLFFHILGGNISMVQIIGGILWSIGFTASVRLVNEHMSNST